MIERCIEYGGKAAVCVGIAAFLVCATPVWIVAWLAYRAGMVR